MRDILFRGQTRRKGEYIVNMAGDKCESHWVYGGIFPQNKDGDFAIIYQQEPEIRKFTVYADTVGQFTGLTDKNSARIFEGDIVHCVSKLDSADMVVIFECGQFRMVLAEKYHEYQTNVGYYDINCFAKEVIGNIHDKPELLKTPNP